MKKDYERAEIEFVWLDGKDILTESAEKGSISAFRSIGGSGYDRGGWT